MDISLYRMIPPDVRDTVFVNSVPLMNVISHEIEDVVINNELPVDFYAGFQCFSFFARQLNRYRKLAAICRRVFVWGVADITPPAIPGVEYIPISPDDSLAREWFLVVDTPEFFTALLTQEQTYGQQVAPGQRRFKGIWTYDPDLVGRSYLLLSQVLGQHFKPVQQRNYERQNRFLIQISNRLVKRQDRTDNALQRNALLQNGLAQSNTPMLVLDSSQTIVTVNPVGAALLEAQPEELTGQVVTQSGNGLLAELPLQAGEVLEMLPLRSPTGATIYASATPVPSKRPDQPLGWIVTLQGESVVAAQPVVPQLPAQRRVEMPPVAPMLQKYLGGIQQLLNVMPSLANRHDVQMRVVSQAQRMVGEMSGQMQRLELLQTLQEQPAATTVLTQVDSLVRSVTDEMNSRASELQVALTLEFAPALPMVPCNAEYVKVALRELIDNALHHAPVGSAVQVRAERHNGSVQFSVHDQGGGIAPEHLPHIFEPFYRAEGSTSQNRGNGIGLGLALVQAVAEAHQGRVEVKTQVGEGSTFTLYVPIAA
ncbi:MAG: ATP-binding protein [Chloroflexaceae bacterium]|nr:ATP-binding protein [Chloroflexaceae bacterium]